MVARKGVIRRRVCKLTGIFPPLRIVLGSLGSSLSRWLSRARFFAMKFRLTFLVVANRDIWRH